MFAGRATISTLLSTLAIAQPFVYVLVCISLFRLRRTQPNRLRPVSVPAYPWVPMAALVVSVLAVLSAAYLPLRALDHAAMPIEWILLLIWIAIGALFWQMEKNLRNSVSAEERAKLVHAR
jgi:ethanolamine permease